ncbi:MAG TPA: hypothetical protein VNT02_12615, partial [Burkholderiales bacterium]|nr:hypothetical protein [Burkholderiales bacterium]
MDIVERAAALLGTTGLPRSSREPQDEFRGAHRVERLEHAAAEADVPIARAQHGATHERQHEENQPVQDTRAGEAPPFRARSVAVDM